MAKERHASPADGFDDPSSDVGAAFHDPRAKAPDMTWHDQLVMLLYIGAEIEHGLMVQYLYSAYSLGGPQVPPRHAEMVEGWRSSILSVAREEMGHLLTVLNMLTLLGAPINLGRRDFPWDADYYPFPFKLEPFSRDALCAYIFAEMPKTDATLKTPGLQKRSGPGQTAFRTRDDRFTTPTKRARDDAIDDAIARVKALGDKRDAGLAAKWHRVGELYEAIIELVADETRIPESCFGEKTYSIQASWDDWGRGYRPAPRRLDPGGNEMPGTKNASVDPLDRDKHAPSDRHANILIERIATRQQAVKALRALTLQGEAPHIGGDETGEPSHFDRFVEIHRDFVKHWPPDVPVARDVPTNPTTRPAPDGEAPPNRIVATTARILAEMFNVRYRMLLTYLAHSFRCGRAQPASEPGLRGMTMHRVFGEMYNIKTISSLLMRLPRLPGDDGTKGGFAGPPFEMPYTLLLPDTDHAVWHRHVALLDSSKKLGQELAAAAEEEPEVAAQLATTGAGDYLRTLQGLDEQARVWIDKMLAGGADR